jgi:Protein of unknown function (DUF3106)
MRLSLPSRFCLGAAFAALFSAAPALARLRGPQPAPPAALKPNRAPFHPTAKPPGKVAPEKEHLQQWMERHKDLPLSEQLHELENEPGFKLYDPQTQQRMRDRLIQLNNMPPQQRDRILERNEILERMTAPQRQQYRAAVQSFAALPPDRRRMMATAILHLREMSPEQREAVVNSDPRFKAQFSESERATLTNLLTGEPYPIAKGPEAP